MDVMERRRRAMELLRAAEQALIQEAANLTAVGVNTTGLTGPLLTMQEAMAELEKVQSESDRLRGLIDPIS
jgi:hypothetical protein